TTSAPDSGRVVCYHTSWAAYRPEAKFVAKDINPYLCTHLIYSFAQVLVDSATIAPGDAWQDIDNHWQFPNDQQRNGSAEDYKNFVYLLQDIDKVFREEAAASGKAKMMLVISIPGNTLLIESGYDLPNLQKYVEFMNVLCYDYHFAYDPAVYHHSPLYPLTNEVEGSGHENEGVNADATIKFILAKGVTPSKLNLGIPLYGRSLELFDENENTLGSPATGQGAQGKATREDGYRAYNEICKNVKDGWKVVHVNETAMGPYAYKGNQWVGYDDEGSARRKGEYAKKSGLGGISFWAIDQDDFSAACGPRTYPLIKAAREGFFRIPICTTSELCWSCISCYSATSGRLMRSRSSRGSQNAPGRQSPPGARAGEVVEFRSKVVPSSFTTSSAGVYDNHTAPLPDIRYEQ
ncbi:hypothetical protein GE061_017559, partial [Apolygus lucorum]